MNWDAVFWVTLAIVGAGLIVFGIVLYRGATATGQRATGAGLAAVGAAMYLVLGMTMPFSASDNLSPAPVVGGELVAATQVPDTNGSDGLPVATETGPTVEPMQLEPGDIAGLLLVSEVIVASGYDGTLSTGQLDMKSMAAEVDPTQVEHMDSFDSLGFDTPDGMGGLTLTTIDFDSEAAAEDHMVMLMQEIPVLDLGIADVSGAIEINAGGFGSIVVFKKGEWVVQLHTSQTDGTTPLVSFLDLQDLAGLVASRLP